jgi:hypothetical protein
VVSPILANILLSRLDKFVEETLIPQYTKGATKKLDRSYKRLASQAARERRKGNGKRAKELKKQYQKLPSQAVSPDFRRLKYVRYADDFLLGFIGTKAEAEEIKQKLQQFLREEVKLELSETKTLVTHARTEAARFLGYEVTMLHDNSKQTPSRHTKVSRRSINGIIGLRVPKDVLQEKCDRYLRDGKAKPRNELLQDSDFTIIAKYQIEYKGIVEYYRLAYNLHTLARLKWVMNTSLLKTLASKLKMTVSQVARKFEAEIEVDGKKYTGLQVIIPREGRKSLVATWGGVPLTWNIKATLKEKPVMIYGDRSELIQRLLADTCELCGSHEDVEVHHVRKMSNLHEYPGRPKPEWVVRMIALKRKTLLLCRTCHEDVDNGRPLRRQIIKYSEVQEVRKEAMAVILESRVL